jgi:hypothetical protein
MSASVDREIHFYRVNTGYDASGQPIAFDPVPTLTHINKLKWIKVDPKGRYWKDYEREIACWVDSKQMPFKIKLGNIRRDDFPQVEQGGQTTPLEMPEDASLSEQTHMVFLGNNIVGCEFNFHGPRITKLSYYLADKAVGIAPPELNFDPILRQDVYKELQEFEILKLFRMKIRAPYGDRIKKIDDNLGEAFNAAYRAGEAENIELILRPGKNSSTWLSQSLLNSVKSLVRQPDLHHESSKFIVSGYSRSKGKIIELDLLNELLITKKSIRTIDVRSKALNSDATYGAIISAYEELKSEILDSASISV